MMGAPDIKKTIEEQLDQHARTLERTKRETDVIAKMAESLINAFKADRKLLALGNGGSAADAQHFAAEFVGRFERNRAPLSAIALTANTSNITCLANDFGYDEVFERQVRAFAKKGDVLVAISTSGNSLNVLKAARAARELGAIVLGFAGESGGELKPLCEACLCVPSKNVARIQEMHITVIHLLCLIVEDSLFPDAPKAR